LYIDDLNISDADMIQVRNAADHYLAANLQPTDRVAMFTSEQMLSDFTSDPAQIHDALFKLHASARALAPAHYCPNLSDYQALAITQNDADALALALDEQAHCGMGALRLPGVSSGSSNHTDSSTSRIQGLARNIVDQAESLARTDLQELEQVVKFISQMPGQRTMILVSPGFLSQSEQYQLDRVVDDALRSQVVISALDPRGLTILMREADPTRSYIPTNANAIQAARRVDSMRELSATGVLAEMAQGTGGEYFHDSNDLKAGLGALAGSPTYYILTFAPAGMKHDGNFHALKVTLAEKEKGFTIQARRGYFAPKGDEIVPQTVAETPATLKPLEPKKEIGGA
jgi:VWFA-related protein